MAPEQGVLPGRIRTLAVDWQRVVLAVNFQVAVVAPVDMHSVLTAVPVALVDLMLLLVVLVAREIKEIMDAPVVRAVTQSPATVMSHGWRPAPDTVQLVKGIK